MVKLVVESARHGGHIKRPWIGAQLQAVDAQLAGTLNLDRPGGALVSNIYKGGPAARAGLEEGDVIRAVDGYDANDPEAVRYRFATKSLGGKVKLTYLRNGQMRETQMALESPPETPPADRTLIKGRNPFAGATVANISPAIADELALDNLAATGVIIMKVEQGSNANQIQFHPGDIIVAVGDDKITSVKALKAAVAGTRQQWNFAVKRGERTFTASVGG